LPKLRKFLTTRFFPRDQISRAGASPLRVLEEGPLGHEHAPAASARMWGTGVLRLADFGAELSRLAPHPARFSRPGAGRTIDSGGAAPMWRSVSPRLDLPMRASGPYADSALNDAAARAGMGVCHRVPCRRVCRRHAWPVARLARSIAAALRTAQFVHANRWRLPLRLRAGRPVSPGTKRPRERRGSAGFANGGSAAGRTPFADAIGGAQVHAQLISSHPREIGKRPVPFCTARRHLK